MYMYIYIYLYIHRLVQRSSHLGWYQDPTVGLCLGPYRGTSLMRNAHPPRNITGP